MNTNCFTMKQTKMDTYGFTIKLKMDKCGFTKKQKNGHMVSL